MSFVVVGWRHPPCLFCATLYYTDSFGSAHRICSGLARQSSIRDGFPRRDLHNACIDEILLQAVNINVVAVLFFVVISPFDVEPREPHHNMPAKLIRKSQETLLDLSGEGLLPLRAYDLPTGVHTIVA